MPTENQIHDGFDYNPDKFDDWQKVNAVLKWASTRPAFEQDFIRSIHGKLEQFNSLTMKQAAAVDNLIRRWQIKVGEYLDE